MSAEYLYLNTQDSGLKTQLYGGALGAHVMFFVTNHIEHGAPNTPYNNFIFTL